MHEALVVLRYRLTGLSRLILAKAQLSDTRELDENESTRFFGLSLPNLG